MLALSIGSIGQGVRTCAGIYGFGGNSAGRRSVRLTLSDVSNRPWAVMPDDLDIVINLQQVLVSQDGADTSEIDALIEAGFVISNVTVLDITPLYMTFYVRLWRYQTAEEKQLYPTGTITARSAMAASHPKRL